MAEVRRYQPIEYDEMPGPMVTAEAFDELHSRLTVENDRLQQRVKHLEAKLQQIADQYAVDCL